MKRKMKRKKKIRCKKQNFAVSKKDLSTTDLVGYVQSTQNLYQQKSKISFFAEISPKFRQNFGKTFLVSMYLCRLYIVHEVI